MAATERVASRSGTQLKREMRNRMSDGACVLLDVSFKVPHLSERESSPSVRVREREKGDSYRRPLFGRLYNARLSSFVASAKIASPNGRWTGVRIQSEVLDGALLDQ